MVAPEVDLITPISYMQFPEYLQDYEHVNVVMLWRNTDDNTEGVNIMRHMAEIFLIHPQVQFFYLQYQRGAIPDALKNFRIEHFPTVAILFRGEVFLYKWEEEKVYVNLVDEEDEEDEENDEESGENEENEENEHPHSYEGEKKLRQSGVLDLINDVAGTSVNLQGKTVPLTGVYKPLKKYVDGLVRFDLEAMKQIQYTISSMPSEMREFKRLYHKAYKILMTSGTPGIWKEWRSMIDIVRAVNEYNEMVEYNTFKNILRIFARDLVVEVPSNFLTLDDDEGLQDLEENIHADEDEL